MPGASAAAGTDWALANIGGSGISASFDAASGTLTLNGTASSNGASTTVTFQYGLTTSYGSSIAAAQSPLAAGATLLNLKAREQQTFGCSIAGDACWAAQDHDDQATIVAHAGDGDVEARGVGEAGLDAIDAGHGSGLGAVMARAALRLYKQKSIEDEIERQLDAFERQWQAAPDHIDGHQHVQQFAVFREALAEVLMRRYGSAAQRPWLRVSHVAQPGLKAQVISAMGAQGLQQWAQQNTWPTVGPLLGAYGFDGSLEDYARHMQDWLAHVPTDQVALIMCHPAVSAQADDAIGAARKREFAYLASHDFGQHMAEAGVRLVRGSGKPLKV